MWCIPDSWKRKKGLFPSRCSVWGEQEQPARLQAGRAVPSTVGGGNVALGRGPSAKPRAPEMINAGVSLFHAFPPGGGAEFQIKGICLF